MPQKLINKIETKLDVFKSYLSKGATDSEIQILKDTTGLDIPNELIDLLKITNGEGNPEVNYGIGIFSFQFNSIEDILIDWKRFRDWENNHRLIYQKDLLTSNIFNPKRLPFASDGSGQFLCIDYDPGVNGKKGQIIYLPAGEAGEAMCVISSDFNEFLHFIVNSIENNSMKIYDERNDWDEDEWKEWKEEENSSLSDLEIHFEKDWKDDWTDIADRFNEKKQK